MVFQNKIQGMTPIEKNVTVLDNNGYVIGSTYPKRAKGLVKKGRAEYADTNNDPKRITIKLLYGNNAHAPTVINHNDTEDTKMSKVINFNARDFKFDSTCENNVGTRMFISDSFGNNVEAFELGNWMWDWSQIVCDKKLEKNTDYVFRFAMTGGYCDTHEEVSQFIICPIHEGAELTDDWDDRYTYSLAKSAYKPTLSKRSADGEMLRVYEIPFNTGDCETIRFVFVSMRAVAKFMPAEELQKYSDMEDMTYDQMWEERSSQAAKGGLLYGSNIDLSGAIISEKCLNKIMEKVGTGTNLDLQGACIGNNNDE